MSIFEQFPKAAQLVKAYYLELFLQELLDEDLPDNFKEFAREIGISDEDFIKMYDKSPRGLFDAFDEQGVFIEISVSNGDFSYKIYPRDAKFLDVTWYKTRKEAEAAATQDAFKVLNDMLCEQTES